MNRQNLAGLYLLVDRVGGLTKLPEVTTQQNAPLLLQPQKILHAPSPCYFPGVRAVVHTFAVPTESENRQQQVLACHLYTCWDETQHKGNMLHGVHVNGCELAGLDPRNQDQQRSCTANTDIPCMCAPKLSQTLICLL